ncbi:MAG: tetratricopeptide repeat protein, partial [Gammaproteobacteria bacterium]
LDNGQAEQALEILSALSVDRPDDPHVYFHLGLTHSRLGSRDAAIDAYRKSLSLLPSYQAAAINLGLLLNDAERHQEARDVLEHAVEITSGRRKAKTLLALGKAELALGASDEAVARLEGAIAFRPDYAPAWLWRGIALRSIPARESDALESIRSALKLRPRYADAWYELGVELSRERPVDAIENLETALDLDPDHSSARELLARLYRENGRKVSARKQYRLLANANRGTLKGVFYRGEVALLRDEFEKAIEHFEEARAMEGPLASKANQRLAEAHYGA